MKFLDHPARRHLLAMAALVLGSGLASGTGAAATVGAKPTVASFDANTWARLRSQGPRPAAYVFTNTFCASCPMAVEVLQQHVAASGRKATLAAVVMDAQGDAALVHARHYTGLTQFYTFDGFAPEIRQTVDPQWRNITPYTVLIGKNGEVLQRITGVPEPAQLRDWLR